MICACHHDKAEHKIGDDWITREACTLCDCKKYEEDPNAEEDDRQAATQQRPERQVRTPRARHHKTADDEAVGSDPAPASGGSEDEEEEHWLAPASSRLVPREFLTEDEIERGVRNIHELSHERQTQYHKSMNTGTISTRR